MVVPAAICTNVQIVESAVQASTDGRRARGAASRQAIVEAAGRVVVASGLAAVTHRAVAEEAGVSLARTTYHFPTIEALLRAVQRHLTDRFDVRLLAFINAARGRHASIIDACCDFLEELLGPRRAEFLASVELVVAAARRPELLSVGSLSSTGVIPIMVAFGADEDRARATFAAVYGFAVIVATQPKPISAAEIRHFVTATIPSRQQGSPLS
ncbi:MAG: TetR/AcrR family transcriptional regulator, fatty acid biosynthesis regulator [Acidimicrobiaceae bacterium]|nr:TetR/AcrR family transcriptional regulator, fatty acid biosynthesis regulator [Acidimicrobiaceae bacterium]